MITARANNAVHRELEVERMIHFSDAVFAISIALLILEVRLPVFSQAFAAGTLWQVLLPFINELAAFTASFILIGVFWARHVKLCRYLQQYDDGIIASNLLFLFFIVTFPFATSAMASRANSSFLLPVYIYLGNITCCTAALYWLSYYMFRKKPGLTVSGHVTDKEWLYQRSKYSFMVLSLTFLTIVFVYTYFPKNPLYQQFSYLVPLPLLIIARSRMKKFRRNQLRPVL